MNFVQAMVIVFAKNTVILWLPCGFLQPALDLIYTLHMCICVATEFQGTLSEEVFIINETNLTQTCASIQTSSINKCTKATSQ